MYLLSQNNIYVLLLLKKKPTYQVFDKNVISHESNQPSKRCITTLQTLICNNIWKSRLCDFNERKNYNCMMHYG